ncbi:MAG: NUDIX hydrolase [Candidatus Nealsonbacteria bacterium]|nr:NUDIX hydrolase [Candidatus Nealsonbacteria bacterium]
MEKPRSPILAVDGVILEEGKILLEKRSYYPFIGYWVIPGGHVEYGETVEEAVKREMKEELGISVRIKKLIGVYSDPKRDPRYHVVSMVFLLERTKGEICLNDESLEFQFFPLDQLPENIGFDHRKIINDSKREG